MANAMTRAPDFPTDEASLAQRFDTMPWIITYKQQSARRRFLGFTRTSARLDTCAGPF